MQFDIGAIDSLEARLEAALAAVSVAADLEMVRRDWLSKEGIIKTLFKQLRDVPPDGKPAVAAKLNAAKERLESFIARKEEELAAASRGAALERDYLDL